MMSIFLWISGFAIVLQYVAAAALSMEAGGIQVDKFLSSDYRPGGHVFKLKDNTEFYSAGSPGSKRGIIIIPDTFGWNSGRIRNIADFFGENDCVAVIPNLLGSTNQESSGAGLFEVSGIGEYIKSITFDVHLKPKLSSIAKFMKDEGVEKIALLGYSWGAWVGVNVLASPDLVHYFVCGAFPHPSINLEERLYGGSLPELFSRVERPLLLLPAKGDPDEYLTFIKLLKYKLPTSEVVDYRTMDHGFFVRGRIDDPHIYSGCKQSLLQILSYFNYHFQTKLSDIVDVHVIGHENVETAKSWVQSATDAFRSWTQQAKDAIWPESQTHYTKTCNDDSLMRKAQDAANEGTERAKQTGEQMSGQWRETAQKGKEYAQDTYQKTQDTAGEWSEKGRDAVNQGREQAGDAAQKAQDATGSWTQQAQETIRRWSQHAFDTTSKATEQTQDAAKRTGQQAQEQYEAAKQGAGDRVEAMKEGAQSAYEQTKRQASDTAGKVQDTASQYAEQVKEKANEWRQQASDAAGKVQDKASELKEKTKEAASNAAEKAQGTWDKTKNTAGSWTQQARDAAGASAQKVADTVSSAKEKVRDTASQAGERVGENVKQAGETIKETSKKKK